MLERPGYTSQDYDQIRISWEMACRIEADVLPNRTPGGIADGFLNHMAGRFDRNFGTAASRVLLDGNMRDGSIYLNYETEERIGANV